MKPKDLCGIPWRVAFALQADGWYLRSDIIWHKPNVMPESVLDRPSKSHEYLFLLSKSDRYYYDQEAIKEPVSGTAHLRASAEVIAGITQARENGYNTVQSNSHGAGVSVKGRTAAEDKRTGVKNCSTLEAALVLPVAMRNKRTVWSIPTAPYREAHYATFPSALVKPCVLAGSRPGDWVLDPFGGSGTTGEVALELGRRAALIELSPFNCELIRRRCAVTPGLGI